MSELTQQEMYFIVESLWDCQLTLTVKIATAAKNGESIGELRKQIELANSIIGKFTTDKQEEAKIDQ